ncbi:ATP-dependent helicase, partial [Streptomyces sp. TRM76130]|nr:ATP-dependent helicase [Streptomyces sp. TRM76130]
MNRARADRPYDRSGSTGKRSGGPRRRPQGGGGGRRPSAPQGGEFALPQTITPALPAVESFAELD